MRDTIITLTVHYGHNSVGQSTRRQQAGQLSAGGRGLWEHTLAGLARCAQTVSRAAAQACATTLSWIMSSWPRSRQHVESARPRQTTSASSASTAMSEIVVEPWPTARPGGPGFAPGRAGTATAHTSQSLGQMPGHSGSDRDVGEQPGPACDTTRSPIRGAVILGSVVGPCTSKQPLHSVDSRHQQLSFFWRQGTFVSLPDYTPLGSWRDRANRIHLVPRGRARGRRITPVVTVAYSLG